MAKLIVTDNIKDRALASMGAGQVLKETSFTTQRIQAPEEQKKYNIQFISSEIKLEEERQYEVATIKVTPAKTDFDFLSSARIDFGQGTRTNHFFKLPQMIDLIDSEPSDISTSTSQASYSFESIFNYISEDYDKLQVGISEYNLYSPLDRVSKQDFLNTNNKSTNIINFGRGSKMKNFVMPTMKVQQGSAETPYYNYLRVNQRIDNGISNFATKIGIFDELLQDYLFGDKSLVSFDIQDGLSATENNFLKIYNLEQFFKTDREMDLDNFFTLNQTIKPSRMSLSIRKLLMKGFLKDASTVRTESRRGTELKPGFRRFEDIYKNLEAHKEIFCYSLDKHDGRSSQGEKIQTFYAPALVDSTPIIDTQVKYGKAYTYKLVGHYMIIGNSYEYVQKSFSSDPDNPFFIFEVINRPSIVMIPMDIFTKTINVVQMPPVYPQVSFKTKNDSGKKISIYLSPTKSELSDDFVTIEREDENQLLMMKFLPNARSFEGKFKFKTYGDQGLFEVFRLDYAPRSYEDFRGSKIGEVSMPFKTQDAIFQDFVPPNKKFYYMFRSVNQKGMVSNPTIVYESTLLIDADESKVIVNKYSFPVPRDKESVIGFRKLVRITLAIEHILFDNSQEALFDKRSLIGTIDNLKLGIVDKSVWGRKFKIRVKSKTSGKMIDIILSVDLTKNKTEEEF